MKHENLIQRSDKEFRRVTGVKRATFNHMLEIVKKAHIEQAKGPGGRPPTLSLENRLLMTLEYLREYRTYASIGVSYGLSESRAYANIRWTEDVLIKSKAFSLPGKKALLKSDIEFEVILVDATESPIERPKKSSDNSILVRKRDTLLRPKL